MSTDSRFKVDLNYSEKFLQLSNNEKLELPESDPAPPTIKEQIISTLKLCIDKRMLRLMPQIFWTGISIAIYSSLLSVVVSDSVKYDPTMSKDENDQNKDFKTSLVLISFGFGEVLGCFFLGYVVDKYGSRRAVFANLAIMIVTMAYFIEFLMINQYNLLAFIMAFLWGF